MLGIETIALQTLNGLQFGVTLFLFAAGLTLVLGIMNVINLAHGSFYMIGAYYVTTFTAWTGSFTLGLLLMLPTMFVTSLLVESVAISRLYSRDHLDQVLATFGIILTLNEAVKVIWGADGLFLSVPDYLQGNVTLFGAVSYPIYRLVMMAIGLTIALLLYLLIGHTRLGMIIRAGASNREMVQAIGINIRIVFAMIFALGAMLAGLAGGLAGPIFAVEPGMGDNVLILALVTIVVGGIGSIRGSFFAAILLGMLDALGRGFLPALLATQLPRAVADAAAPALASIMIYLLMALVLFFRPQGLFSSGGRA
jgi:branched-chain amino acid transport system permease protein